MFPHRYLRKWNPIGGSKTIISYTHLLDCLLEYCIFEDDADWDVVLKSQLARFARGSIWLLNTGSTHVPQVDSPYGPGWDLLWLGHCGDTNDPQDRRSSVIPRDPTVEPTTIHRYGERTHFETWEIATPPDQVPRGSNMTQSAPPPPLFPSRERRKHCITYRCRHVTLPSTGATATCAETRSVASRASALSYCDRHTSIGPETPLVGVTLKLFRVNLIMFTLLTACMQHQDESCRLWQGQKLMKSSERTAKVTEIRDTDIEDIGLAVGHEDKITADHSR